MRFSFVFLPIKTYVTLSFCYQCFSKYYTERDVWIFAAFPAWPKCLLYVPKIWTIILRNLFRFNFWALTRVKFKVYAWSIKMREIIIQIKNNCQIRFSMLAVKMAVSVHVFVAIKISVKVWQLLNIFDRCFISTDALFKILDLDFKLVVLIKVCSVHWLFANEKHLTRLYNLRHF